LKNYLRWQYCVKNSLKMLIYNTLFRLFLPCLACLAYVFQRPARRLLWERLQPRWPARSIIVIYDRMIAA
jgi:hypothetical protein